MISEPETSHRVAIGNIVFLALVVMPVLLVYLGYYEDESEEKAKSEI